MKLVPKSLDTKFKNDATLHLYDILECKITSNARRRKKMKSWYPMTALSLKLRRRFGCWPALKRPSWQQEMDLVTLTLNNNSVISIIPSIISYIRWFFPFAYAQMNPLLVEHLSAVCLFSYFITIFLNSSHPFESRDTSLEFLRLCRASNGNAI